MTPILRCSIDALVERIKTTESYLRLNVFSTKESVIANNQVAIMKAIKSLMEELKP